MRIDGDAETPSATQCTNGCFPESPRFEHVALRAARASILT
jgi:hypothetical protein